MKQGKQISAVLFGVLAVFQMFIVRYMMNNAALTGVPIMVLAEIAAAPVFAAACVWLFSRDGVLSPVGKKVLAGSALFYLLFIAVYYDLEVNLILSGLSTLGQELANGLTPGYLGMAAKVVLLVLARRHAMGYGRGSCNARVLAVFGSIYRLLVRRGLPPDTPSDAPEFAAFLQSCVPTLEPQDAEALLALAQAAQFGAGTMTEQDTDKMRKLYQVIKHTGKRKQSQE